MISANKVASYRDKSLLPPNTETNIMSKDGKLVGKKALVTGSGTGIGREVALEFARQGADVVLHYAHAVAGAESAVAEIQAMGRKAAVFKADFDSVDEVVQLGEKAIGFLGQVDCLINNAGITFNRPFGRVTPEQYDRLYHVNVRAQFFLTQRIAEDMLKHGGGAVVNITSVHGVSGAPEHSVYAGSKGAIIAYTRTLAVELAHKGIRVNAIAPGCIPVENYAKVMGGFDPVATAEWAKNAIPVGRVGKAVEIGKVAAFLCCDDAGFIIGQTVVVDGGTTSLMSLISDFRNESAARFGIGYLPGV
jgi:NAD(P)-dependent dehydrogenase (short-subunit alcohol dehydrogenase family)